MTLTEVAASTKQTRYLKPSTDFGNGPQMSLEIRSPKYVCSVLFRYANGFLFMPPSIHAGQGLSIM